MTKVWPHGSALTPDQKAWRYFSPSTLMAGDSGTSEGCLRRVFYEKKMKIKPPQTRAQDIGIELHAQNEHYLLTGEKNMNSLALAGLHMLPKPFPIDPRIMVEHEIGGTLATAPLRAAGVPVAGYIDCIDWQGTNPGTSDITDTIDPEGTVQVSDWKTSSDLKWVKTPKEMSRTLQMTVYGKWAMITKKAEQIRLTHGYYITKGRPQTRKVSLRVHRDQIDERWEYVETLASSLVEIIKEDNPDKVPANTRACDAYRGCPHRSYCSAGSHNSLASLFSSEFAADILGIEKPEVFTLNGVQSDTCNPTTEELTQDPGNQPMSLLAKLQAASKPTVTPAQPDVKSEMKRLALEEFTTKYPGIAETISELETLGLGMPQLSGEAARCYAAIKGRELDGVGYAGSGELAEFNFSNPADLAAVLTEARGIVAARGGITVGGVVEAPVVSPFPEDAPPALASPAVVEPEPITNATDAITTIAAEKKKPGRKKKGEEAPAVVEAPVTPEPDARQALLDAEQKRPEYGTPTYDGGPNAKTNQLTTAVNLFVDCMPSCAFQSFWPYVQQVTDLMTKHYGGLDYRACEDPKLDYGKWKAFLAAGLRNLKIPAGNYVLDNSMNETGAVVVEAMREVVAKSGGLLVRGIR